jgi:phosphoribosylformimino-5-aminoimidazole carboxamide ribotide isomerase
MNLYPAIDLYEGQVVRLEKGDFTKLTVYSSQPSEIALQWLKGGATWLHVVDLEGAKTGVIKNLISLTKIRKAVKCHIEFGGGIRTLSDIDKVLAIGVDRVILGTKALDGSFFEQAIARFGSKLAVGLDVRDGFVQTQGWLEQAQATLEGSLKYFNDFPLETIIYTDIKKDGMLAGPNFEQLEKVLCWSKSRIILSGGIATLEDIKRCREIKAKNFEGPIIGKALYEKKFSLEDAVKIANT